MSTANVVAAAATRVNEAAANGRRGTIEAVAVLALATLFLAAGCPESDWDWGGYYGEVPLGEPDPAVFEPGLVGRWRMFMVDSAGALLEEEEEPDACASADTASSIIRFNAAEYLWSWSSDSDNSEDTDCRIEHLRLYLTRLGDALFLNLNELDDDTSADDPVKYEISRIPAAGHDPDAPAQRQSGGRHEFGGVPGEAAASPG